jgi:hypothetical protein
MTRLLYFTGQRELEKSCVRLDTFVGSDGKTWCSGIIEGLPDDLPEDATIVLEAYNATYLHRMILGPAREAGSFSGHVLERLPEDCTVRFRVKIASRDQEGLPVLLAARDRIKTVSEDARGESILPIRGKSNADMRHELWRVEVGQLAEGDFELWVNADAGSLYGDVRGGKPSVIGLVLPMAVRTILEHLFLDREQGASDEVRERWLQMGESILGIPRLDADVIEDDLEETRGWVDRFIESLCARHSFPSTYEQSSSGVAGGEQQ